LHCHNTFSDIKTALHHLPNCKKLREKLEKHKKKKQREKKGKQLDYMRVLHVLQDMGGEAGISALATKLRVQEGELRMFLKEHPKYFVVKGPFVYTKTRWQSLKTNGGEPTFYDDKKFIEGGCNVDLHFKS